jgi:hypothetical protein
MSLPAGSYTVRVTIGSMPDCTKPAFGSAAYDVKTDAILAGHRYTVAGIGNLSDGGSLRLVLFEDDNGLFPDQARVRFIHAVSTNRGSLDFGSGAGGSFANLVTASSYTATADTGGQPYLPMAAVSAATWSMRPTGSSTDLKSVMSKVTLEKGTVYTATWLTRLPGDFELSLCADTATATNGLLPCQEIH